MLLRDPSAGTNSASLSGCEPFGAAGCLDSALAAVRLAGSSAVLFWECAAAASASGPAVLPTSAGIMLIISAVLCGTNVCSVAAS